MWYIVDQMHDDVIATINGAGQVTIPEPIRDALGLRPGSEVVFEYRGGTEAAIHAIDRPAMPNVSKMRGVLKAEQSTDEIMAILRGDD